MTDKQTQQTFFGLEKIYIKDISYEAPAVPEAFLQNQTPEVNVQISLMHRPIDKAEGYYEVTMTVEIDTKGQEKQLFFIEVHQAGVFRVQGVEGEMLERTLEISCAYVLLPFVRETVNDLVSRGGFPQLLINPINFDALYEQKRMAKTTAKGTA